MGVVYKFKPEVVEFVVQEKKKKSSLSCRKLADLVFSQLQMKVSKSAVNNILKQASLSNPPKYQKPPSDSSKKFQIPQAKKDQILEEIRQFGKIYKEDEPLVEEKVLKEKDSLVFLEDQEVVISPSVVVKKEKGMGNIFLKAVAWETGMEQYTPFFIEGSLEEKIDNSQEFIADYFHKKSLAFESISSFKVVFKDGSHILFDPGFTTCWMDNVPKRFSFPINKAMGFLSEKYISNKDALIFNHFSRGSLEEILNIFSIFSDKKIKEIDVFGIDEKLTSFDIIPNKRRNFMIGIWDNQDFFSEWTKNVHSEGRKSFYHEALGQDFYFLEDENFKYNKCIPLNYKELYKIILWRSGCESPFLVILSNNLKTSVESVISDYLFRWVNYVSIQSGQKLDSFLGMDHVLNGRFLSLEQLPKDFKNTLHMYCCQHFFEDVFQSFSLEQAQAVIYNLSGNLQEDDHACRITLMPSSSYPHKAILQQAAYRINERCVMDSLGRKVFVFVE